MQMHAPLLSESRKVQLLHPYLDATKVGSPSAFQGLFFTNPAPNMDEHIYRIRVYVACEATRAGLIVSRLELGWERFGTLQPPVIDPVLDFVGDVYIVAMVGLFFHVRMCE